jgi:hypothetical protein
MATLKQRMQRVLELAWAAVHLSYRVMVLEQVEIGALLIRN